MTPGAYSSDESLEDSAQVPFEHTAAPARRKRMPSLEDTPGLSAVEMRQALADLRADLHELKKQNMELRQRLAKSDAAADSTSDRGWLEPALRASEARYREIFELAVDGILQGDASGIIIGANAQMLKLAGRSLDQLLGQHVSVLFEPAELAATPLRFDLLNEDHPLIIERRLHRPDGSQTPVEMHSKRMPDGSYQTIYRDLTERRKAERTLSELNEMFSLFMRHSPVLVHIKSVTPTGSQVLHVSDSYEQMFSQSTGDLIGKTSAELFTPEVVARVHAVDLQVVSSGAVIRMEEEINGRSYAAVKFPIVQGSQTLVGGFTIDITVQKQAEEALREWNQSLERRVAERTMELQLGKARFRQLAEATFEGIAIGEEGILIDGNTQLGEIHGCEIAEMLGRPVLDFVAPESRGMVAESMRLGHETTYEYLGLRKDGSTFPAEVHGRTGAWHGKISRISAVRDLTESRRITAQLKSQQAALEHAQRLALISEVSGGIIHQISQPLCAMGANLAALQARFATGCDSPTETLEILQAIGDDLACMRGLIFQMRSLAHSERPSYQPTDLTSVLGNALILLRQDAAYRGVVLAVGLGDDLPPVLGDEAQLTQVILNLTHNAFNACATCPPERRRVVITTRVVERTQVELEVCDSGTGIAPELMDYLFAPFFSTQGGLGIGLRLSRTIVESHGGSIRARNNPDGFGATFRVTLPGYFPAADRPSSGGSGER